MSIVYLLKRGNLVFKTIHDTGCVDFVTIDKHGKVNLYDVKTKSIRTTGKRKGHYISRPRTNLQVKLDVNIMYVDLETGDVQVVKHVRRT